MADRDARSGRLLLRGRYVVAAAGEPAIEDGAVAVEGDRIAAVGPYEELRAAHPEHRELGSDRHLILPGLVNSHHHGWGLSPFQLGARDGYLEPFVIDLMAVRPTNPYLEAAYAATRLIRSGVTVVQHAGFPRDPGALEHETGEALRAYEDVGMRVLYGIPIQDRNTFVYADDDEFLRSLPAELAGRVRAAAEGIPMPSFGEYRKVVAGLRERYRGHPRIELALCPQGPEWCSDELLGALRELASEAGMPIHMHCLESPYQREYMRREKGLPIVEWLDEIGFLGADVSLAHGVWMTRREIQICAERGVSVCHNPSSNLRLRVGVLPLMAMLESGVNVALGMDSTTLNEDDDMLQEMRIAAKVHGLPGGLEMTAPPSAATVLAMATTSGARALGAESRIGSLRAGMEADAVLIDYAEVSGPYVDAGLDPLEVVLQRGRASHVDTVLVGGEVIVSGGEPTRVDLGRIEAEIARSASDPIEPRHAAWIEALHEVRPHVIDHYRGWAEPELSSSYVPNSPD